MGEAHKPISVAGDRGGGPPPEVWARRLQRGDPNAVGRVRERVERILTYGALSIPHHERDDLTQEIMTEIWQMVNRSRFDVSSGFWGFVELVTSRRCIDWLRARREKLPLPHDLLSHDKGPLRQTLEREQGELVSELLEALDGHCRELITLRIRDELSYSEIAGITGRTEGALRVQYHRCVQRARENLERIAEERGTTAAEGTGA